MKFLKWLTYSKARLNTVLASALAAVVVITVGFVVLRQSGDDPAPPTAQPTITVTQTTGFDEEFPEITETVTFVEETLDPVDTGVAAIIAGEVVAAWLAGDMLLTDQAHPVLLDTLALPPVGAVITDKAVVTSSTDILVNVDVPTSAGIVSVTMKRTDEAGWLALAMALAT